MNARLPTGTVSYLFSTANVEGSVIFSKNLQSLNALTPIENTPSGMSTDSNPVPLKAISPIICNPFGRSIDFREVQYANVLPGMDVRFSGRITSDSDEHP